MLKILSLVNFHEKFAKASNALDESPLSEAEYHCKCQIDSS